MLSKFEAKAPTCVMFDSRLHSYSRVIQDAKTMSPELDVDFMQVSVGALLKDIQEHARMWVGAIAKLMHSLVKPDLVELHEVPRLRAEIAPLEAADRPPAAGLDPLGPPRRILSALGR